MIRRKSDGAVLLHRRPAKGLLAGSWEFPGTEKVPDASEASFRQVFHDAFLREYGISIRPLRYLGEVRHVFTHREWIMQVFEATLEDSEGALLNGSAETSDWCWEDLRAGSNRMMATAFQKIRKLLI